MNFIENSLRYLKESLSNYEEDDDKSQSICKKLENQNYESESEFIDDLDDEEIAYLDALLEREISYAHHAQDEIRVRELNDIYELLF